MNSPQKQTPFQDRKAIVPEPSTAKREGTFSRIARIFHSRRPKAEPARNFGNIQSRDLLALGKMWGAGEKAPAGLERALCTYYLDIKKARHMRLSHWAKDIKRLLDCEATGGALEQKKELFTAYQKAVLAFSARCARKAEITPLKNNPQKEVPALIELKMALEQISSFMERGEGLATVRSDISIMAKAISSLQNTQAPRDAIVPEAPDADSKESPAMAG